MYRKQSTYHYLHATYTLNYPNDKEYLTPTYKRMIQSGHFFCN